MLKDDFEKLLNTKIELKITDGSDFEVPMEGSLGLLALGAKGLIAWRQKRMADFQRSAPMQTPKDK
jgi:hypothetical protein